MDFNTYQQEAAKTAIYPDSGELGGLLYTVLGLTGEAGELANKVKKILRDSNGQLAPYQRVALGEELSDALWYTAMVAKELGLTFDDIALMNLEKLALRQKNNTLRGSGDNR